MEAGEIVNMSHKNKTVMARAVGPTTQSVQRKDNWWTGNKVMGTQGPLMCMGRKDHPDLIQQKSYCSTKLLNEVNAGYDRKAPEKLAA